MNNKRLDWILIKADASQNITYWEQSFIDDMITRREKYGNDISISEKQEDILERICDKCH